MYVSNYLSSHPKCLFDINCFYYFTEMFRFWSSLGLNVELIFISSFSPLHLILSQLKHCYLREVFPDAPRYATPTLGCFFSLMLFQVAPSFFVIGLTTLCFIFVFIWFRSAMSSWLFFMMSLSVSTWHFIPSAL